MAKLPYSTHRTDTRPIIYREREWDATPSVRVSSAMRPFLDEVAMLAANEIGAQANENVAATFAYNMFSRNDYFNDDFKGLVDFVCDSMELRLDIGETRRIDDDMERTIKNAVTMYTCGLFEDFPELMDDFEDEHGPAALRKIQFNVEKYLNIVDEIERMNSGDRSSRGVPSRGRERDSDFRSQYSSRGSERSSERPVGRDRDYGRDRDRDYGRGRGRDREERVLTGREARAERISNPVEEFDLSDFAYNHVPVEDMAPRRRDRSEAPPSERSSSQSSNDRRHFKASNEFMHDFDIQGTEVIQPSYPCPPPPQPANPPAPQPMPDEMQRIVDQHRLSGNGINDTGVYEGPFGKLAAFRRIKENEMDINEHSAIYTDGSARGDEMFKEAAKTVSLEAAVLSVNVTAEQIEGDVVVSDTLRTSNSLGSLLIDTSDDVVVRTVGESGDNTDGIRKVYHVFGVVTNSILGFPQLKDLQVQLRTCDTLRDLCGLLQRTRKAVDTHAPAAAAFATDLRSAVSRFDRIITKEINTYCRVILKISNGNAISSFIENFDQLIETVNEKCDASVNNALLVFLSQLNDSIKETLNPTLGLENILWAKSVDSVDTEDVGMAMMPMAYLITHVPFTMAELGIKATEASVIDNNDISEFLRAALNTSGIESPSFSNPNRVLVTRDMEAFRVYETPGRAHTMILSPIGIA